MIDLIAPMGAMALEFDNDLLFNVVGVLPSWVKKINPSMQLDSPRLNPENMFPFLKNFIMEAGKIWSGEPDTSQPLGSGWWTEVDYEHDVHYCHATALCFKKKKYLIIEHATDSDEIIEALQKYKEALLEAEDLLEEKEALQKDLDGVASDFSLTDQVTGLHNPRGFYLLADHQIKLANRKGVQTIILMLDIVNRDAISKKYGGAEELIALNALCEMLQKTYRDSDIIAKFDNHGFAVLALETDKKGEKPLLGRLKKNLDKYNATSFKTYDIILAAGVIKCATKYTGEVKELVQRAGYELNQNKRLKKFL